MAKAKPAEGPKAPPSKADILKRKLDGVPAAIQPLAQALWSAREGWRDEQRDLVQDACDKAMTVACEQLRTALQSELEPELERIDQGADEGAGKAIDAVRELLANLQPVKPEDLHVDTPGLEVLDTCIERAVDGVDDDIESFIDYVCDPDLCPKDQEQPSPLEHLQLALAECDNETIGQELAGSFDTLHSLDAEVLLREFIHHLSPQHRCIIAAILAAS